MGVEGWPTTVTHVPYHIPSTGRWPSKMRLLPSGRHDSSRETRQRSLSLRVRVGAAGQTSRERSFLKLRAPPWSLRPVLSHLVLLKGKEDCGRGGRRRISAQGPRVPGGAPFWNTPGGWRKPGRTQKLQGAARHADGQVKHEATFPREDESPISDKNQNDEESSKFVRSAV